MLQKQRVYIIGMMGVGKTTIGRRLANQLGFSFHDLDQIIETKNNKKIHQIFEEKSEEYFRNLESSALKSFQNLNSVLATGGGTPIFFNNLDWMLNSGVVVWFQLPLKMMAQRIIQSKEKRPLASANSEIELQQQLETIYKEREKFYQKAHFIIETKNVSSEKLKNLANQIKNQLK